MHTSGLFVGVDPGTQKHNLGLAFVNYQGELIHCCEITEMHAWGAHRAGPEEKLPNHLWQLESRFANTFHEARLVLIEPVLIAGIEDQWMGKNPQVALTLSKQWGTIFAVLAGFGIYSVRIQPTQAKKALTGHGKADKYTMVRFAQQMGMEGDNDNVADAIGIALATREKYKEWELANLDDN